MLHVQRGACVRHTQSGSVINRQSAGLTAMVKESPLDPPPMRVNTRSQYVWVTLAALWVGHCRILVWRDIPLCRAAVSNKQRGGTPPLFPPSPCF